MKKNMAKVLTGIMLIAVMLQDLSSHGGRSCFRSEHGHTAPDG